VNEALRFPPAGRQTEPVPHIRAAALYEIQPVWIRREGQLENVIRVIAVTVPVDQPLECILNLNTLSAAIKGVR
jgi:hypothetical protein